MIVLQHDDPQIAGMMQMYEDIYKYIYVDIVFPWLRYVYPGFSRRTKQHFTAYRNIVRAMIEEHQGSLSSDEKPKASSTQTVY